MFNRNFLLIIVSNIVLGMPMPMLILLGGLAGARLADVPALATLPPSIQMLAGIVVSVPVSVFMGRAGRKSGFLLGAILVVAGGLLAAVALHEKSFALLCIAHFVLGAALTCVNFFRFAAAESVDEGWKANAISYTLASGLVAALFGPLVFTVFQDALAPVPFAGAYVALAGLGLLGVFPVLAMKRELFASVVPQLQAGEVAVSRLELITRPKVLLAIVSGSVAMATMVLLMIPTPLAMANYGFDSSLSADVIRWHVIAMFAPGFFTGWLINRFGIMRVILCGMLLLLGAGGVAWWGISAAHFYVSLVLLGVGWNFGFIGGTYLLQSELSASERPLIQGVNDTIIAVCSSTASLVAGAIYVQVGWSVIGLVASGVMGLMVLGIVVPGARKLYR